MASNMYRVGDYIYVETSPLAPYQIRRIEELNKNQNGSTEAKVVCFFRRKDIPPQLQALADRHQGVSDEDQNKEEVAVAKPPSPASVNSNLNSKTPEGSAGEEPVTSNENEKRKDAIPVENEVNDKTKAQLKQRELFLSRQIETLPTTSIRGKCTVTLLNETEAPSSYLEREDAFFYTLVYDPQQKTLLADRGEIRVGSRYQVDPMPVFKEEETDTREAKDLETLVWATDNNLTDVQIDQFLVVARSVGTFARALDCSSSVKQPSLHMSAAAASRDITLFQAMDMLHQNGYDLGKAMSSLVPTTGPVLCRDQMEEWSASEANLFEEAMEKYGKDFNEIRQEFLPWKTMSSLIEYYYLWKTTDRYVQQKRVKAVEAESKLKQIYVPNYTKPHPAAIAPTIPPLSKNGTAALEISVGKPCESCSGTTSTQWYAWSNPQATGTSGQGRLCQTCWSYWKKYGDLQNAVHSAVSVPCPDDDVKVLAQAPEALTSRPHRCSVQNCGKEFKLKSHLLRHCATAHGLPLPPGSPRPMMKTRTAFYLAVSPTTRLARKLCSTLLRPRHAARFPFLPINSAAIRQELQVKLARRTQKEVQTLLSRLSQRSGNQYQRRIKVSDLTTRIAKGQIPVTPPAWVVLPDKSIPKAKPERVAFPKPPKAPDGSLIYERVPNAPFAEKVKRRPEEQLDGPAAKKAARDSPSVGPAATPPLIGIPSMAGLPLNVSSVSPSPSTTSPYLPTFSAMPGMTGVQSITPMPLIPGLIPPSLRPTLPLNIAPDMYGLPLTVSPAAKVASPLAAVSPSVKQAPLAATPAGPVKLGSRPQGHGPSGRVKQLPTWMDAPDDLYFNANQATKKHRRQLSTQELRRAARKPWRPLKVSN